jgi:hypothetical protein
MRRGSKTDVNAHVADLTDLDRAALVTRWQDLYDLTPPKNISTGLLRRAVAYRLQEKVYGGLKPAIDRYLRQVVTTQAVTVAPAVPTELASGARLIREWNGQTYEVMVTGAGFEMDGKAYGSLSEIARTITGTGWSGPRFFGLRKVKSK